MEKHFKTLLLGFIIISALDAVGSIASTKFAFFYGQIIPFTIIIYIVFGYLFTKQKNLKASLLFSALMGLWDGTIGWGISILLNANTGIDSGHFSQTSILIIGTISSVLLAIVFGFLGSGIYMLRNKFMGR